MLIDNGRRGTGVWGCDIEYVAHLECRVRCVAAGQSRFVARATMPTISHRNTPTACRLGRSVGRLHLGAVPWPVQVQHVNPQRGHGVAREPPPLGRRPDWDLADRGPALVVRDLKGARGRFECGKAL